TAGRGTDGTVTGASLQDPTNVWFDANRLLVSDYLDSRVLLFAPLPAANGATAIAALGQPSLTTFQPNTIDARHYVRPTGIAAAGSGIAVGDGVRVLLYDAVPADATALPSRVLGQPDMASMGTNAGGRSAKSLCDAADVATGGGRLVVADRCNHRVLVW